ncbi:12820_t:CDS:2, partial [Funneliformis caledonium]
MLGGLAMRLIKLAKECERAVYNRDKMQNGNYRGKQKNLVAGYMQNIMQFESSYHTNTRKRKASVAFNDEFDYLYGIVTT